MRILQRKNTTNMNNIRNFYPNKTNISDLEKIQKTIFNNLWSDNEQIQDIKMGKHDDVFNEEDKKEVIQMIEQDNFEMRKQRILSGIKKEIKNDFRILKQIFGIKGKYIH
jgi:hypothetical protein